MAYHCGSGTVRTLRKNFCQVAKTLKEKTLCRLDPNWRFWDIFEMRFYKYNYVFNGTSFSHWQPQISDCFTEIPNFTDTYGFLQERVREQIQYKLILRGTEETGLLLSFLN